MKAKFRILPGNVLFTKWNKDEILFNEVVIIMEEILRYINKYNIIKYIDDISECEVNWQEADEWIVNDWYIRALEMGVVKNALIVKQEVEMKHKDEQCELKSFNNFNLALKWIHT